MPSLFKTTRVEVLRDRRASVESEIQSLIAFRDKIDRRIAHLEYRPTLTTKGERR